MNKWAQAMARSPKLVNRVLIPVAVLSFFFLVPVGSDDAPIGELLGAVVALACVTAVGWLTLSEARGSSRRFSAAHLALGVELAVIGFALADYLVARAFPAEFVDLHTRLDALYFSLTTMSTVGYGDVSAHGQLARALVAIQLCFNLVFVAALVGLIQDRLHSRSQPSDPD